jgi:hypothetical protein
MQTCGKMQAKQRNLHTLLDKIVTSVQVEAAKDFAAEKCFVIGTSLHSADRFF